MSTWDAAINDLEARADLHGGVSTVCCPGTFASSTDVGFLVAATREVLAVHEAQKEEVPA